MWKINAFKSIARIITPKKGEIKLDGMGLKSQAPKEIAKKMAVYLKVQLFRRGF